MRQLHGSYTSPYVRHCRIALLAGGLDFEFVETVAGQSASPTGRVPFLVEGDLQLSDSTSILRHIRLLLAEPFLPTAQQADTYCLANTVLDAAISLFLFERLDGLLPEKSKYLRRQSDRVQAGLVELEARNISTEFPLSDAALRVVCLAAWGSYRRRFDLSEFPRLQRLVESARRAAPFRATEPPAGATLPA